MYLKIAYIALSVLMTIILLVIGFKAIMKSVDDAKLVQKKKITLITGLILWQVYVYGIAYSGLLTNFDFPPRFFIFLILPLFIFTGIFIFRNRKKAWITEIPENWLIVYQSFRIIVESIFVASVAQGVLNKEVTIEGYNFDMIFAYTAPVIAFLLFKKIASRKLVIYWNYAGLVVISSIIFLFLSSIFYPQLFGSETMILPEAVIKYPYVLVAGFLMPSAVFIHVLSIVQLSRKRKLE
ncbi:MAG: hypothetical protein COA38_13095 [Fluviicola sp.]|nr:MAG: hypothetical protein COA38_13095 [Fluviicola sp.]